MADLRIVITRDMDEGAVDQPEVAQAVATLYQVVKLTLGPTAGISILMDDQRVRLTDAEAPWQSRLVVSPFEVV